MVVQKALVTIEKTLVFPVYNASKFIANKLGDYKVLLEWGGNSLQMIFVCDGCSDESEEILRGFFQSDPRVEIISYPINCGKGFALQKGLSNAAGKYIVFTDIDMTYPVGEVINFFNCLESGEEFIVANRRDSKSVLEITPPMFNYIHSRTILSGWFNKIIRYILGIEIPDTQAGLKGFHRDKYRQIHDNLSFNGFIFDIELILLFEKLGVSPTLLSVRWIHKEEQTTVNLFLHGMKMFMGLLKLRWKYGHLKNKATLSKKGSVKNILLF